MCDIEVYNNTVIYTKNEKKSKIAFQDNQKIDIFWTGRSEMQS